MLASASNALVLGFNVKADNNAKRVAEREQIEIRYYDIIYKLIEDIEKAMEGLLEPEMIENTTGEAEVRAVFKVGKQATAIAGSYMKDGKCERSSRVRVWRKEEVVFTGKISSLKRFKDDVKEVASGYEFGVGVQNYNELEVGDRLEFFQVVARHEISKA
jgi:translation initiation factor IF-2